MDNPDQSLAAFIEGALTFSAAYKYFYSLSITVQVIDMPRALLDIHSFI